MVKDRKDTQAKLNGDVERLEKRHVGASPMHLAVFELLNNVEVTLEVNKEHLPHQVEKAANGFIRDLRAVLKTDDKLAENIWNANSPRIQFRLAKATIAIIHKHEPKLEAAPGFWNQVKAHINKFLKHSTSIKYRLETKNTGFSGESDHLKQDIKNLMERMKTQAKDMKIKAKEKDAAIKKRGPIL